MKLSAAWWSRVADSWRWAVKDCWAVLRAWLRSETRNQWSQFARPCDSPARPSTSGCKCKSSRRQDWSQVGDREVDAANDQKERARTPRSSGQALWSTFQFIGHTGLGQQIWSLGEGGENRWGEQGEQLEGLRSVCKEDQKNNREAGGKLWSADGVQNLDCSRDTGQGVGSGVGLKAGYGRSIALKGQRVPGSSPCWDLYKPLETIQMSSSRWTVKHMAHPFSAHYSAT